MSANPRHHKVPKTITQTSILKSIRKIMPRPTQVVTPKPVKHRAKRSSNRRWMWEVD